MAEKDPFNMTPEQIDALMKDKAAKAYQGLVAQEAAAKKGVATAQKAYDELGTAEQGALGSARAGAARAFAQGQARGGGGSGAALRQSAAQRGVTEGAVRGQFAEQRAGALGGIQAAEEKAAKAETDLATEQQKMLKAAAAYGAAGQDGVQAAYDIFQDYADEEGGLVMTDADREAAIERIDRAIAVETNPNKKKGMEMAKADILSGKKGASGAWDTGSKLSGNIKASNTGEVARRAFLDPLGIF